MLIINTKTQKRKHQEINILGFPGDLKSEGYTRKTTEHSQAQS